ncbi:hypothetical protein [Brunnivagina elsteri]|jgi:hypothetical protein|uniref:Uncharacterized protein n=1 Tax=Brunnivagina elsteri CCALA 953 TaxID=987040 RepID=A0A2A2TID4_9CYAN|nr:hypothetical protein [Calothrix elsteri]PAX53451.1 hypothetical protein CK510_13970 [Calothrix elsteri CCALA 953]
MDNAKRIVLQPSIWDTDNLGDLVAEGVIDCDDLSLRAVGESQREEYLRLSREWDEKLEDYWNSIGWEEFKVQYELLNTEEGKI